MTGEPARDPVRGMALPETALGLAVVLAACVAGWQAAAIPVSPLYARIGPTVFPMIGAALLGLLGLLLMVQGMRGGWQDPAEAEVALDWRALGLVGAGLGANVALIGPLGFTLASTVMFTLIAAGFGSRRPWRDAPIGFALALGTFFGFARALGVNIGMGPFERALIAALGI
ncbi:MAG: tripartite tricarboxylate transporter TctB family protein [Gemmobacter sp.]|jgi:putative tricarboxylic transport membrane protein